MEIELLNSLFNLGAPCVICVATIRYLGIEVKKLNSTLTECISKMNQRLDKVEDTLRHELDTIVEKAVERAIERAFEHIKKG